MKTIIGVLFIGGCFIALLCYSSHSLRRNAEHAYFEGQKDCLEGNVRIAKDSLGNYKWTKSCWDSGNTEMSFDPAEDRNQSIGVGY